MPAGTGVGPDVASVSWCGLLAAARVPPGSRSGSAREADVASFDWIAVTAGEVVRSAAPSEGGSFLEGGVAWAGAAGGEDAEATAGV